MLRPRRGALVLACTLVAACSEEAVPAPQSAAGSLASSVEGRDLKDPFAAHEGERAAPKAEQGALKDPFDTRGTPGATPSADLKNPFDTRGDAAPAAATDPSTGLKDPFRGAPKSEETGLKNPFEGKQKADDDGLKDPFRDAPSEASAEKGTLKNPFASRKSSDP